MTPACQGPPICIIGLGNALRGDDAVGLLAARRLRARIGDCARVVEAEMAGVEIVDSWADAQIVILIDAVYSGASTGSIHRYDASSGPIAGIKTARSSHSFGALEAVELARMLGMLPPTVIVFGIEVGDTAFGGPISPAVSQALDRVMDEILWEYEAVTTSAGR